MRKHYPTRMLHFASLPALDECLAKINDRMEAVLVERLESLKNEIREDFWRQDWAARVDHCIAS